MYKLILEENYLKKLILYRHFLATILLGLEKKNLQKSFFDSFVICHFLLCTVILNYKYLKFDNL